MNPVSSKFAIIAWFFKKNISEFMRLKKKKRWELHRPRNWSRVSAKEVGSFAWGIGKGKVISQPC